jgi:subfamily B ATP-binding cassette protein MsbA
VVQQASDLLQGRSTNVLWLAPVMILVIVTTRSISLYLQTLATNRLALSVMRDLQIGMYEKLVSADFARLEREPVGAIISRFTNDITMLREGLIRAANNLMRDALTVVGCLAVMVYLDWVLTLVVCLILPLAGQPVLAIGKAIRKRATAVQDQMGDMSSFLEESFSGARMVKTFALEDWAKARARTRFGERFRLMLSMVGQRARIEPVMEVAGGVALAVVFGVAGWRAVQGATDLADLLGFIVTLAGAQPRHPRPRLAERRAAGRLCRAGPGVRPAGRAAEPDRAQNAQPLVIDAGAVDCERCGLSAMSRAPTALHQITLEARPGETIALGRPVRAQARPPCSI